MEIDALRAFLAVAETGSFSRAAEKLHLSQPAVSKRIAALETALGSRLFDRVGRHVRLTETGLELLPRADSLLREIADIRRQIANLSGEVGGTLTMGTSHHIGLHRLPMVLRRYLDGHPDVKMDIRFKDSEQICEEVARGDLELGIVTLPTDPPPQLEATPLWTDPLDVVVGRDHPLASRESVTLDRLLEHTAVLPAPETFTRALLLDALGERASRLQVGMSTNYLETLKMLAVTGLGWTLLPRIMLDHGLAVLPVKELALQRRLGVVTHRRRTLSNAAMSMIRCCRHHAAVEPPF